MSFFAGQRLTASLLQSLFAPAWTSLTLQNSWQGNADNANGVYYRLLPLENTVEIIGDIYNTTATGNSVCATLPASCEPSVSLNFPAAWNNYGGTAHNVPWINVSTAGAIQVTGIEVANKTIFFYFRMPLGNL